MAGEDLILMFVQRCLGPMCLLPRSFIYVCLLLLFCMLLPPNASWIIHLVFCWRITTQFYCWSKKKIVYIEFECYTVVPSGWFKIFSRVILSILDCHFCAAFVFKSALWHPFSWQRGSELETEGQCIGGSRGRQISLWGAGIRKCPVLVLGLIKHVGCLACRRAGLE